jgi:hypothetical protein
MLCSGTTTTFAAEGESARFHCSWRTSGMISNDQLGIVQANEARRSFPGSRRGCGNDSGGRGSLCLYGCGQSRRRSIRQNSFGRPPQKSQLSCRPSQLLWQLGLRSRRLLLGPKLYVAPFARILGHQRTGLSVPILLGRLGAASKGRDVERQKNRAGILNQKSKSGGAPVRIKLRTRM